MKVMRGGSLVLSMCVLASASACTIQERTDINGEEEVTTRRQIIQPEDAPRLPIFSSAVRSGDLIFLSGALGALPGVTPPQLIEGGIGPETRQTMENIIDILDVAGATVEDLIKCTVFLADIDDYAAMNEVYQEYMPDPPPARSAVAGSGLALGALVEVECIAAVPEGS